MLFNGSNMKKSDIDKEFLRLSHESEGLLDFEMIWNWYWTSGDADMFPLDFSFDRVVSLEDRASRVLYDRFVLYSEQ